MNGTIYMARNKVNGKCYVGQTLLEPWNKRITKHISDAKIYKTSMIFHKAIRKYGKDSFKWEVLETNIDNQELLNSLERLHIARYESSIDYWGYNIKEGGSAGKHHQDTIQKIKDALVVGKHKISKARMGMEFTDEHKDNISKAVTKMWENPEYVDKQSKIRLKTNWGKYPGTRYKEKKQKPWTRCWVTTIWYNGRHQQLGFFNDPISGVIVYKLVWDELHGGE